MTETIEQFREEVTSHRQNKAQGVAHVTGITEVRKNEKLRIDFELPEGEETFSIVSTTVDETLSKLYDLTDANPPCVDDIIGGTIPVEWNEKDGNWELDASLPTDETEKHAGLLSDTTNRDAESWSEDMSASYAASVFLTFCLGGLGGISYYEDSTTAAYFFFALTVLVVIASWIYWYPLIRDFAFKRYDWIDV